MGESPYEFAFSDFVDVWRAFRRWHEARSDLGSYHRSRYEAFSRAFDADLNEPPVPAPATPDWLADRRFANRENGADDAGRSNSEWANYVHWLVLRTEDTASRITDPWDGMLEAPESVIAIHQRYNTQINAGVAQARAEMLSMSSDLLAELYPAAANRSITQADLRSNGFDPELREPDPLDDF